MSNICWVCYLQSLSFIACFILENIFGIFTQKWIMKYSDQSFHFWEKNFCVQSRRSSQSAFSLGNHTKSIQTRFLSLCFCVGGLSAGFLSSFALEPVVRQHMIAAVHGSIIHHVARLRKREIRRDKSLNLTEARTTDSEDLSLGHPSRSFYYSQYLWAANNHLRFGWLEDIADTQNGICWLEPLFTWNNQYKQNETSEVNATRM